MFYRICSDIHLSDISVLCLNAPRTSFPPEALDSCLRWMLRPMPPLCIQAFLHMKIFNVGAHNGRYDEPCQKNTRGKKNECFPLDSTPDNTGIGCYCVSGTALKKLFFLYPVQETFLLLNLSKAFFAPKCPREADLLYHFFASFRSFSMPMPSSKYLAMMNIASGSPFSAENI